MCELCSTFWDMLIKTTSSHILFTYKAIFHIFAAVSNYNCRIGFGTPMPHHCIIAELCDKVIDPIPPPPPQRTQQHGKLRYLKVKTSAVWSFSIMVCNVLHVPLPCQWIGRGGPIPCLPKSPDFSCGVYVMDIVYTRLVHNTLQDLGHKRTPTVVNRDSV
jgi:hypothetical protein